MILSNLLLGFVRGCSKCRALRRRMFRDHARHLFLVEENARLPVYRKECQEVLWRYIGSYVFVQDTSAFAGSVRRKCRLNVAPMNTKSHGPAKSEGTRRRSARVQASWQRKDAMDVFGSSKARAQKSDGEHRFASCCGCIG